MGLDLVLYKKEKNTLDNVDYYEENELAYGRKTWAIANFFMNRSKYRKGHDDYDFRIDREDWNAFISAARPFFEDSLVTFGIENYDKIENAEGDFYDLEEKILDKIFGYDEPYQLGANWEAVAALNWYRQDAEVQKVFDDEDAEVWLAVSF